MSLPLAFGTTLETVPAPVPYLRAEPVRVAEWRETIGTDGLKIGICWQGSATRTELDRRLPLAQFAPLSRRPDVRLFSLQTGFGIEQLTGLPAVAYFDDGSDDGLRPFVDTAAMMAALDLIITTDTSIAHLAGAHGRPTWIALRHVPDWRWGPTERNHPLVSDGAFVPAKDQGRLGQCVRRYSTRSEKHPYGPRTHRRSRPGSPPTDSSRRGCTGTRSARPVPPPGRSAPSAGSAPG